MEGVVLAIPEVTLPPGAALPLRGVALTHFDGKGNLTQVDHVLVANVPGNPLSALVLHLVVVKGGKEVRTLVEANAVTSIGIKIQ